MGELPRAARPGEGCRGTRPDGTRDEVREVLVDTAEVTLAARDHGGSGAPLLLLHGAGGNLATMSALAEALRPAHRVVTVDLRGHGRSGDGPWRWDAVLADLASLVDQLGMAEPAVVGVSLGGMLAALWAREHPECPGVVSLDGNAPPTRPDQLPGLDEDRAAAELARLRETFAAMSAAMAAPMTAGQVEAALAAQRAVAGRCGADDEPWVEGFRRNLVPCGGPPAGRAGNDGDGVDGMMRLRPGPDLVEELRLAMETIDLFPVYREARCPLLLVLATEDMPEQQPFQELYAAHRRGLAERTAAAARENPLVRVVQLDGASHLMVAEQPARIADLITDFLAAAAAAPEPASTPGIR